MTNTTTKHGTNPFGAARPREEVLASKGIDFHAVDDKVEEKARRHQNDSSAPPSSSPPSYASHPSNSGDRHYSLLTPDHIAEVEAHNRAVQNARSSSNKNKLHQGGCTTTPSQIIHEMPLQLHKTHTAVEADDDEATQETASTSTVHSHSTIHSSSHSHGHALSAPLHSHLGHHHHHVSPDPFGNARPREEVLAGKGVDAKAVDERIDRRACGDEEHVFSGHCDNKHDGHDNGRFTITAAPGETRRRRRHGTKNVSHNKNPNYHPAAVLKPKASLRPSLPARANKPKAAKVNPFGDARPREEVLAKHGVDYRNVDRRVDRKIEAEHLTEEQEAQAEVIRLELSKAEAVYWDANENEMPEKALQLAMEQKRRELHDLLEHFQENNLRERQQQVRVSRR